MIHFPGFAWESDPDSNDTDGDGLTDAVERSGWNVSVVNRTDGAYPNPYRFNASGEVGPDEVLGGNVTFDSDPQRPHSDGDGVDDRVEKELLRTDPRDEQTYGLTREHQVAIVDAAGARLTRREVRAIGFPMSVDLDDATDDFDFVRADDGSLEFRALDRNKRTDTWLSNERELVEDTDPWDPDTDDDGLTDGQEVVGITAARLVPKGPGPREDLRIDGRVDRDLSPVKPDTDGDGWWDGWIGVYGVGRTDDFVVSMVPWQDADREGALREVPPSRIG